MTIVQRCVMITAVFVVMTDLTESFTVNETTSSWQQSVFHFNRNRRLTLPPGTALVITPTLFLPMDRNLPTGYGASTSISIPIKISFDDFGITSEDNKWGLIDDHDAPSPGDLAGGDREMLFKIMEEVLVLLGMEGKDCLLRAICEMFEVPLLDHGFVGEMLELFFSSSRAPKAKDRLADYTKAEMRGKGGQDCTVYREQCTYSFFKDHAGKYAAGVDGSN
ncbi:uncharacterized protein LOC122263627 isoform X2 [Penaeus japonicus]|nr:uncharacterized protein LOC122263627 isoform X2 [Penaeus japonicus]